jgi:hypothetical protein
MKTKGIRILDRENNLVSVELPDILEKIPEVFSVNHDCISPVLPDGKHKFSSANTSNSRSEVGDQ